MQSRKKSEKRFLLKSHALDIPRHPSWRAYMEPLAIAEKGKKKKGRLTILPGLAWYGLGLELNVVGWEQTRRPFVVSKPPVFIRKLEVGDFRSLGETQLLLIVSMLETGLVIKRRHNTNHCLPQLRSRTALSQCGLDLHHC